MKSCLCFLGREAGCCKAMAACEECGGVHCFVGAVPLSSACVLV